MGVCRCSFGLCRLLYKTLSTKNSIRDSIGSKQEHRSKIQASVGHRQAHPTEAAYHLTQSLTSAVRQSWIPSKPGQPKRGEPSTRP